MSGALSLGAGLNFGSTYAAGAGNLGLHISLWGGVSGINFTSNSRINFVINGTAVGYLSTLGFNGAIGSTAANTGAFTNLSASGSLTGSAFANLVAPYQLVSEKGAAGGYCPLDASTLIPSVYLPSYVDDVREFANLAAFPVSGTIGIIYVALDTGKIYRWSGSTYIEISPSPGSTDAVPEGATNLYFTTARASAAAPVQSVAGKTGTVTLVKADVGLGNVDNTSDANKPVSTAQQTALNLKEDKANKAVANGYAPLDATNKVPAIHLPASASAVAIADTPPAGATDNSLWWESDSGLLWIKYNDGNTTQWVAAVTPAVGPQGATGAQGTTGPQGPQGNTGAQGPQGVKGDTGNTGAQGIQGIQGNTGTTGSQGPQGIPGNTVLYGAGTPAAGTGVDGNFYINTSTNFIYGPKAAGAWPAGTSLVGPQGTQGIQGVAGNTVLYGAGVPATGLGIAGNFYINTSNNFIYGPKTTVWPAGVSMVGPQGATGNTGSQGIQGVKGDKGDKGDTGNTGATGADSTVPGPQGPQGPQGPIGNTGPQGISGTSTVIASDTPPAGAADNSLWWQTDKGDLWVRYNDGTSTQWVEATPRPVAGANNPVSNGTAAPGTAYKYSREDHVHPSDATRLPLAGGTLSGNLEITKVNPGIFLNKSNNTLGAEIYGRLGTSPRWRLDLGNNDTESGSNAGSNFALHRFTDAGGYIGAAMTINRIDAKMTLTGDVQINKADAGVILNVPATNATTFAQIAGRVNNLLRWQINLGGKGTESGSNAGSDFAISAYDDTGAFLRSPLSINRASGNATFSGHIAFGSGSFDGTGFQADGNIVMNTNDYPAKPTSGAWGGISDARVKNVIGPYKAGLEQIIALNPVTYTFKGNSTYEPLPTSRTGETLKAPYPNATGYQLAVEGKIKIGLLAQAVEGVMPEMITQKAGYIDGVPVPDIRQINVDALTYALINAVKELKGMNDTLAARIAVLEAA
jgi:hypothetical protein